MRGVILATTTSRIGYWAREGHQFDASANLAVGIAAVDWHSCPGGDILRSKFGDGDDGEQAAMRS
jgi:hypothetical protein